jgi:hypothetical protein
MDALQQDATMGPQTIRTGRSGGETPESLVVALPATAKVRARVKRGAGRPGLEAVRDVGKWAHDRQAHETREAVYDRDGNWYKQGWRDSETAEVTWPPKVGRLDDPNMHGPASHRP